MRPEGKRKHGPPIASGKGLAFLPPLVAVVVAYTHVALAQDGTDAPTPTTTEARAEQRMSSRVTLASGILTFGTADATGDAATRHREADGLGAMIMHVLLGPEAAASAWRSSSLPAKPTVHLSPATLGAGGYGMLAIGTF